MKDTLNLPTYDETPFMVRVAQRLSPAVYWLVLGVSGVLAALTMLLDSDTWVVRFGAFSAIAAALAAAGFVLHSRPRILRKRWADLYWDPDIQGLVDAKIIDYESTADGVWVIRAFEHRKGIVPSLRVNERRSPTDPWVAVLTEYQVSHRGDIAVLVGLDRSAVDAGKELQVVIS